MKYTSLQYTLKIWLTSACAAPFPFLFDQFRKARGGDFYFIETYPALVLMGLLFSVFTWLAFWGVTELIVRTSSAKWLRRLLASVTGTSLSLVTFHLFLKFWQLPQLQFSDIGLQSAIAGSVCVAFGSWYFKMPVAGAHSNDTFI